MALTGVFEKIVGVGAEGTYGVVGTVNEWIDFEDAEFNLEIPLNPIEGIWGKRDFQKTFQEVKVLTPSISFPAEPENGLGLILKAAFGTSSVVQIGTFLSYKHTFRETDVAELPSLFARVTQLTGVAKDYTGLKVNTLEVAYAKNETVKISVEFIGKDELTGTSMTGTYGTQIPFTQFGNMTAKIDGTVNADVMSAVFTLNNNLASFITVGTSKTISKIGAGRVEVTGEVVLLLQDQVERAKFLANTSSKLELNLQAGTFASSGTAKYELNFTFPKIEYSAFPFDAEDGVVTTTAEFVAYYGESSVGTNSIIAELINSKASY